VIVLKQVGEKMDSVVERLFFGEVDEEQVFPYPAFSDEQKEMAREMTNAFVRFGQESIDGIKMDQEAHMPEELIQQLAEMGLCGLAVPEEFGGLGLDYSVYSRVFGEIGTVDGSVATMLGAHQSIGYRALINEGTKEQKDKWLPLLASGEKIAAFCLTEPGAGSDAYSIKTKAVKNSDNTYTINGQKLWITNARLAGFYTVFCKTDHEIDGVIEEKISCFIVEGDQEGVSFGEKENKMGIRASETRAVFFDNVKIPASNLIGVEGKGFKIAMNVLNSGRLSLGAGCAGAMREILKHTTKHAAERKQFGQRIGDFGMIQDKLSLMASLSYAAESVVYLSTGNMVKGMDNYYFETAVCKIFSSESLWRVIDMGMQIAGGNGYMKEYPYERIMRDARINLIFEGTNEILRCFIALSGIRGPSENLRELGKIADISSALKDPVKSLGVLTDFAKGRLGKIIPARTLTKCHPDLEKGASHFSSMVSSFAIQVENTLIKYGKNIIEHELPQKRIANMAIELYVSLAVLSRTTAILERDDISDERREYVFSLAKLALKESRQRFIHNYKRMSKNFDREVQQVAGSILAQEGYGLDIIDY
jgi:acyl-CoA dehydrogenase family member 9